LKQGKRVEDYYRKTSKYALNSLKTSLEKGLDDKTAKARLEKYGPNKLEMGKKINPIKLFFSQFNDVLIIILLIAAAVSFGLSYVEEGGNLTESLLIFGIVLAIAVIGFFNEYKAEKTVEALRQLLGDTAKVRRGGKEIEIDSADLVPGDIVLLEEGEKIPADIRLIKVKALQINEASLTGESVPSSKTDKHMAGKKALGDQKNMAFSGTFVTVGKAEGVIVATGSSSQLGKIAELVSDVEEEQTPMQKKLDDLGKKLGVIILAISILVFVIIFFFNKELIDEDLAQRLILAFTAAVALAVAAIPEGLAFVVRISLALGARRMASKNALVRKLSAVEALGSTDIIASDKTGTLTKGEMTVRQIFTSGVFTSVGGAGYETVGDFSRGSKKISNYKSIERLLTIGVLVNNAKLKEEKIIGDPTEGSLIVAAAKAGFEHDDLVEKFERVDEYPFSSERKRMSTVHKTGSTYLIASKGAPDVLLKHCGRILVGGKIKMMTPAMRKSILAANLKMTKQALRVLGFAYKESRTMPKTEKGAETNLIFVGLQGMIDPPREEVKEVMHRVHSEAGMRVLMITGDHVETAKAIAREIGIVGEAITGEELDKTSQADFEKNVEKYAVYARVNPEHKIRIVQALKANGHQVAMTGDGVNDAPAIKAADIGIAMGINGTDAAKEAADLILMDDQFLTIIDAIEEGRGIFDNVRKFVNYLLSANIAEVITIVGGVIWLNNLVLTAAQLLFINIATDGLPAVALGSDPAEKGIMRYKPHRFQNAIITKRIWVEMFIFGALMSVALLLHYWWLAEHVGDTLRAVSAVFAGMVIYEMIRLIGIRSEYKIKWFSNPWLSVAIAGSIALLLVVVYVGPVAETFGIAHLLGIDWLIIIGVSIILLVTMRFVDKILDRVFVETRTSDNLRS